VESAIAASNSNFSLLGFQARLKKDKNNYIGKDKTIYYQQKSVSDKANDNREQGNKYNKMTCSYNGKYNKMTCSDNGKYNE